MLSFVGGGRSVVRASLGLFGVVAVTLGVAAALIWLVPRPKGPIDTSGAH
jgi:DHA2 family multidrug resistance protein